MKAKAWAPRQEVTREPREIWCGFDCPSFTRLILELHGGRMDLLRGAGKCKSGIPRGWRGKRELLPLIRKRLFYLCRCRRADRATCSFSTFTKKLFHFKFLCYLYYLRWKYHLNMVRVCAGGYVRATCWSGERGEGVWLRIFGEIKNLFVPLLKTIVSAL